MADKETLSVIDALTLAHNTEIAGYFFYKFVAATVADGKGKNVFNHLADEELEHISVVKTIAESVKAGHGWLSYETALKNGAPHTNAGLSIFQKESELTIRLKKNQTDINAVNIAIEAEDRAVEFYGNLLKQASSPQEKVVLTKLFEMEKGHLKLLRWESESLTKTGFWCGQIEYSVEKETE